MRWSVLCCVIVTACWRGPAKPAPEPAPAAAPAPAPAAPKDVVQPIAIEPPTGGEDPCAGGVPGGVPDGVVSDPVGMSPPPPPPPPPPAPPQNVAPTLLEGQRIAGNKIIIPDDATKTAIAQSGKARVIVVFKLCVDRGGVPASVKLLKSGGFPAYDRKLESEMRQWRYRPYQVNGQPVPVCTAVTFIYSQSPPPPPPAKQP